MPSYPVLVQGLPLGVFRIVVADGFEPWRR